MGDRWHDLLLDQARGRGGKVAFSDTLGQRWTWADTADAAQDAAGLLRAAGARTGDRVLLVTENCNATVAFLFGASLIGAAVIPFNARQTGPELSRVVKHADPSVLVFLSEISKEAAAHAIAFSAETQSGSFGTVHFSSRGSRPDAIEDVAVILYTTGTTGDPKGVMLTHGNMRFGGAASANLRWMVPEDHIYGALPLAHVFGLASVITAAVHTGAYVEFEARFSAAKLFHTLQNGVSLLSAVPQMHALLMQYVKEQGLQQLGSTTLRYVSSGGAPLDPDWKRRAEAFYGIPLQNGYGMTETTAGIAATQHTEINDDVSCGPPLPGVEMRVSDGELQVRGDHVMKGYFRAPDLTAEVLSPDGWFATGDLGEIDDQGRVWILGRKKELIIHGGFNVYPPEVEGVLSDHPQVIQAAVIGHMVDGDEKILAFCQVAADDWPSDAALHDWVRARLAGYKRPWRIICAESLPAAATGKILKHKLKDAFAAELSDL